MKVDLKVDHIRGHIHNDHTACFCFVSRGSSFDEPPQFRISSWHVIIVVDSSRGLRAGWRCID